MSTVDLMKADVELSALPIIQYGGVASRTEYLQFKIMIVESVILNSLGWNISSDESKLISDCNGKQITVNNGLWLLCVHPWRESVNSDSHVSFGLFWHNELFRWDRFFDMHYGENVYSKWISHYENLNLIITEPDGVGNK